MTMPIFAEMSMTTFWIIAMVVFLVIEAVTVGIVSIWFAIGALFAMVTAMLGANPWVQIAVFIVASAVTLYFTRPLVKKYVNNKVEPTNADILIGKECRVVETIDNISGRRRLCRRQDLDGKVRRRGDHSRRSAR